MEKELKKRIVQFLDCRGLSVNSLAAKLGIQTRTLQNQIKADTAISAVTLLEILFQYKDLSSEWLMRGEGEMFPEVTNESILNKKVTEQADLIKRQQREIDGLYERIKELKKVGAPSNETALAG